MLWIHSCSCRSGDDKAVFARAFKQAWIDKIKVRNIHSQPHAGVYLINTSKATLVKSVPSKIFINEDKDTH